jgi:hypothetical protein
VIFYAAVILQDTSLGASQSNAVLMDVNLVAVTSAAGFLSAFERRKNTSLYNNCMFIQFASLRNRSRFNEGCSNIELGMCCMFVAFFEFGLGTIV